MIRVDMGDKNVGNVVCLHVDAGETVDQLAPVAGPKEVARAGVDEDSVFSVSDQKRVDRGFDRICKKLLLQQVIRVGGGCSSEKFVKVLWHSSVGKRRYLEFAEREGIAIWNLLVTCCRNRVVCCGNGCR
jgi:hypothetical protein